MDENDSIAARSKSDSTLRLNLRFGLSEWVRSTFIANVRN